MGCQPRVVSLPASSPLPCRLVYFWAPPPLPLSLVDWFTFGRPHLFPSPLSIGLLLGAPTSSPLPCRLVYFWAPPPLPLFPCVNRSTPGLAHLLEHMAFKGTPRVGTRDYRCVQHAACDQGRALRRRPRPPPWVARRAGAAAQAGGVVVCPAGGSTARHVLQPAAARPYASQHIVRPRPPAPPCSREAVLLDSLDEVFYSLQEAGGPREVQRLQQQLAALQKEVGGWVGGWVDTWAWKEGPRSLCFIALP